MESRQMGTIAAVLNRVELPAAAESAMSPSELPVGHSDVPEPVRWGWVLVGVLLVSLLLAFIPGRTEIPPMVGSDYCYSLLAADRMYQGLGPTTPLPVAPLQPWSWEADWGFLTQWPIGYPLLICAVRWITGQSTIDACRSISVIAVALALVGWFVWVKRVVPSGVTGTLIALVAAACSVSTSSLINPSTDVLLVALLPFVMLLTVRGIDYRSGGDPTRSKRLGFVLLGLAGLTSGGLLWIRYAAIFVPLSIGLYLLARRLRGTIVHCGEIAVFALCASVPIVTLVLVNRTFGATESMQSQLNLGHTTGVNLSLEELATAWWNLTKFGFYDYHWYSRWVFALYPLAAISVMLAWKSTRQALRSFLATGGVAVSAWMVTGLLVVLIGASAVFGEKYDYVSQPRYYIPAKPLYFLLFVAPLMLIPRRIVRIGLCVGLLVACSWMVQQEWSRPYRRWLAANREVTPYGQWAHCFEPNAGDLYRWVGRQKSNNLIVVSNFHDHIALETQVPALPIPPDVETLETWIERIRLSRGLTEPRVLFVLDHENRWRDYWIKPTEQIIRSFNLNKRPAGTPTTILTEIFEYPVVSRSNDSAT